MKNLIQRYILTVSLLSSCFNTEAQVQNGDQKLIINLAKKKAIYHHPTEPRLYNLAAKLQIILDKYEQGREINMAIKSPDQPEVGISFDELKSKNFIKPLNPRIQITIKKGGVIEEMPDKKIAIPFTIEVDYQGGKIISETIGTESPATGTPKTSDLISSLGTANGMTPFFDALDLARAIENNDTLVIAILSKYVKIPENKRNLDNLKEIFKYNVFIFKHLNQIKSASQQTIAPQTSIDAETQGVDETSGLASPTMVIDALGTFIAKRFKEEAAIAFLNKFKRRLKDKDELRLLFSSTHAFMLNSDPYNFNTFLLALQKAFQNDLENAAKNLANLLKEKKTSLDEEAYYALLSSLELLDAIKSAKPPADAIESLEALAYVREKNTDLANSLKLLSLLSRNLRKGAETGWIDPDKFKEILAPDPTSKMARELFVGLIYASEGSKFDSIKFASKSLVSILAGNSEKIEKINDYIYEIAKLAEKVSSYRTDVMEKKGEAKLQITDYDNYFSAVFEIFQLGFETRNFLEAGQKQKFDTLSQITKAVLEIYKNVHEKNYALVLVNTLKVLEKLLPAESAARQEIAQYGAFMVNMASAKTSDEMVQALEAATLPVGSYRIKRSSAFSVSLNSYAGLFGARERLNTSENTIDPKDRWAAGFTSPLGIAVNWRCTKNEESSGSSWSLYLPVIDIGAVVSFRLASADEDLPELKWENVMAPGAYLIYGFKNLPLAMGGGIQYGPRLRKVSVKDKPDITSSAFRYGIKVVLDIPIFHFYQ